MFYEPAPLPPLPVISKPLYLMCLLVVCVPSGPVVYGVVGVVVVGVGVGVVFVVAVVVVVGVVLWYM